MSRGPGTVERVIERTFAANPGRLFTIDRLVTAAYPAVRRPEPKHRGLPSVVRPSRWRSASVGRGWRYLAALSSTAQKATASDAVNLTCKHRGAHNEVCSCVAALIPKRERVQRR
jgi:hypothetical protein